MVFGLSPSIPLPRCGRGKSRLFPPFPLRGKGVRGKR